VDITKAITHLGLCAGYGGIELGIKRVIPALRTVALCEIEAFAVANLVSKMEAGLMDAAPVWTDLKTFPWEEFRDRVDILTGGYPCQPFSAAGKRLGGEDPRHLWPHLSRGISILQPRMCFFENVEGHITCGLHHVLCDLGRLGYRTTWGIFSASECGAPHQRKRVFVMANRKCEGLERSAIHRNWLASSRQWEIEKRHTGQGCSNLWPSRPGEQQYGWEPPRVVNSASARQQAQRDEPNGEWGKRSACESGELGNAEGRDGLGSAQRDPGHAAQPDEGMGETVMADSHRVDRSEQAEGREHDRQAGSAGEELGDSQIWDGERRQTQPPLGGDADGSTGGLDYAELSVSCDNRTDELRLLGNGVVPATTALAFCTLMTDLCSPES